MPAATFLTWAWIPIVVFAALAQTARNAAQRSLVAQAGTMGATLARFLYGLPFAAAWVLALHATPSAAVGIPYFTPNYFAWLMLGAVSQIAATAFMLAAMKQRNFVVGVAFSKTDAVQVALFGALFLHELPGWMTMLAIALATVGVIILSLPQKAGAALAGDARAWTGRAAWYGLASGAGFAFSAIGYRGAALALPDATPWLAGAWGVLWAQAGQSLMLGGWLAWRDRAALRALVVAWRVSMVAGSMGAAASIAWFTSFALTSAANVRTLGIVEVVFSLVVAHRFMKERLTRGEKIGLGLVVLGLLVLCLQFN